MLREAARPAGRGQRRAPWPSVARRLAGCALRQLLRIHQSGTPPPLSAILVPATLIHQPTTGRAVRLLDLFTDCVLNLLEVPAPSTRDLRLGQPPSVRCSRGALAERVEQLGHVGERREKARQWVLGRRRLGHVADATRPGCVGQRRRGVTLKPWTRSPPSRRRRAPGSSARSPRRRRRRRPAGRRSRPAAHVLIQAPTGSGKTLAAFLYGIDRLDATPGEGPPAPLRLAAEGAQLRRRAQPARPARRPPLRAPRRRPHRRHAAEGARAMLARSRPTS